MKTIKTNANINYDIKKSKFIGYSFLCNNVDEANEHLNEIAKEHSDATHICYGYVIQSYEKCSDNGEPSGTAGLPILEVIKKNGISNVLVVVVRYFGGIKLGAGGLIRAYSKCAILTIKESNVKELNEVNKYEIVISYANMPFFNKIVNDNNISILDTKYEDEVKVEIATNINIEVFNNIAVKVNLIGKVWL